MNWKSMVGFVIGLSLLVITLLFYGQCSTKPKINVREILDVQLYRPPVTFPLDVRFTRHSDVTKQVRIDIEEAASVWTKFTGGIAEFSFSQDDDDSPLDIEDYSKRPYVTVWQRKKDAPEVVQLAIKYSITANAYAVGNMIVIYNDPEDDKLLAIVLAHELGHVMGLEHVKPEYPALMNVDANGGRMTEYDLAQFCFIYDCEGKIK